MVVGVSGLQHAGNVVWKWVGAVASKTLFEVLVAEDEVDRRAGGIEGPRVCMKWCCNTGKTIGRGLRLVLQGQHEYAYIKRLALQSLQNGGDPR